MATRSQVLALVERGVDYEVIGRELGMAPGLAYLVATGLPADGSDVPAPEDLERPGVIHGSTQHLVNPPTAAPASDPEVAAWIELRARRDGPMAVAARHRAAAPPQPRSTGGDEGHQVARGPDVVDVLGRSHNEVKVLFEQLEAIPGYRAGGTGADLSRRVSIVDMIVQRLSAHEAAEEELFWPAVADTLGGGPAIAAEARRQEDDGKRVLEALRKLAEAETDDDRFDGLVDELAVALRKHVAYEDAVFAEVRRHLVEDQRVSLGRRVARAMAHGPTRPHPHAPSSAGALHVAGPLAAAMDKFRDALGDRPAARQGRPDQRAQERTDLLAAAEAEPPVPAAPAGGGRREAPLPDVPSRGDGRPKRGGS